MIKTDVDNVITSSSDKISTREDIRIHFYTSQKLTWMALNMYIIERYELPDLSYSFHYEYILYPVIGLVVLVVIIFLIRWCIIRRRASQAQNSQHSSQTTSIPQSYTTGAPGNMQEILYDADNKYQQTACTICTVPFVPNVFIRELPCKHIFHKNCIDTWVTTRVNQAPTCPACNAIIPVTIPLQLMQSPQPITQMPAYQPYQGNQYPVQPTSYYNGVPVGQPITQPIA